MDFLRIKLILVTCLFHYTSVSCAQSEVNNPKLSRIVGGFPDSITNYPYLVQILENGKLTCGGSLIYALYVVTAAHCVKGVDQNQIAVVGGSSTLNNAAGVYRKVAQIYISFSYNDHSLDTDVAVIKLSSPMTGRNIRIIPLCNSELRSGQKVQLVGWGQTSESALGVSYHLRSTEVSVIPITICRSYLGTLPKTVFCAYAYGTDACQGDSGGPVIKNGQLCGIVSFGYGCARGVPAVYTNINSVTSFIQEAVYKMFYMYP